MTAYLAKALKKQGHIVSGSDQEQIFPPISTIIEESKIPFNTTPINQSIDLAIIGSSYQKFARTRSEFEQIKKLQIPYISATNYVAQNIGKSKSILVAGSFGKTTITGLVSQILIEAKMEPSIMVGGQMVNPIDSAQIKNSDWSVIEADESINGLDTQAKFLYYPLRYLILTSTNWEHKDSYKTEEENKLAFTKLIRKIAKNGLIVANESERNFINETAKKDTKTIYYGSTKSEYFIRHIESNQNISILTISTPTKEIEVKTNLIGQFNFENILSAVALSDQLKIDHKIIQSAVQKYKGIIRRLELIHNQNSTYIFDDFAQSAPRIRSSVNAIHKQFPEYKIIVYFEPHAGFLQTINGLSNFDTAFENANKVILGKIKFDPKIGKNERVVAKDYQKIIGSKLIYIPLEEEVVKHLSTIPLNKTVIINMSSGGLKNHQTLEKIVNSLKES